MHPYKLTVYRRDSINNHVHRLVHVKAKGGGTIQGGSHLISYEFIHRPSFPYVALRYNEWHVYCKATCLRVDKLHGVRSESAIIDQPSIHPPESQPFQNVALSYVNPLPLLGYWTNSRFWLMRSERARRSASSDWNSLISLYGVIHGLGYIYFMYILCCTSLKTDYIQFHTRSCVCKKFSILFTVLILN